MYNGKEGQRKNCVYEEYVGTVESAIKDRGKSFVYAPGQLARGGGSTQQRGSNEFVHLSSSLNSPAGLSLPRTNLAASNTFKSFKSFTTSTSCLSGSWQCCLSAMGGECIIELL